MFLSRVLSFVSLPISVILAGPVLEAGRSLYEPRALLPRTSCSISGSQSCHNTTVQPDLCCFEAPGGLLVLTQFWDTNPATGPSNSWTIHGLWPDHCDTTFDDSCDPSRAYADPISILQTAGRQDLIDYMKIYWINNSGGDSVFWKHEWDHHGTCMSTLRTTCMPPGSPTGTDAVNYWDRTVSLFQTLPTYQSLAAAGINPHPTTTHTLAELQAAIRAAFGFTVAFDCSSSSVFQVYYYFNLKGSVIDGTFVPIDAPKAGSCPSSGIKYVPKPTGTTTSATSTSTATSTPVPFPNKSTISARLSSGTITGGLLSLGTWSVQTLATYTATASGNGYQLTTSKGSCGVSGTSFNCGSGLSSIFTAVSSGGNLLLAYSGSTAFSANSIPSGTLQIPVIVGTGGSQQFTLVINPM